MFINIVVIYAFLAITPETAFTEITERLICEKLTSFYGLWKDAAFGNDPNRTERAAWIILNSGGSYGFQRWPCSAERNKERWKGRTPDHAIALVHTHSVTVDEKPSWRDVQVAQKLNITLYVISRKGIWSVTSNGQMKKEAGPHWNENQSICCLRHSSVFFRNSSTAVVSK